MKWISLPVSLVGDQSCVSLPDHLWRLLVEYHLLCGQYNGPAPADWTIISWQLHHEPEQVAIDSQALVARGLLLETPDGLLPRGWLERHSGYLRKMQYNRDRYPGHDCPTGDQTMSQTADDEFAALPSASAKFPALGGDALALLRAGASDRIPWQGWATAYKQVVSAPEAVQEVSYLLSAVIGMAPYGSKKSWAAAVFNLLEIAGRDIPTIEAALRKAAADRQRSGLTFSSPYSFHGYVRNELSLRALAARQPLLTGLDTDKPIETIEL